MNGSKKPYGFANVTTMHVKTAWIDNAQASNDAAVIQLDRNIGYETGWFGFRYQDASYTGTKAIITGYPVSGENRQYKMSRTIKVSNQNTLDYDIDTTGGQSGSPVYIQNSIGDYYVIGIHSRYMDSVNRNRCRRISSEVYNWFCEFI